MTGLHILAVGKLKKGFCLEGCAEYLQKLERMYPVRLLELPDGPESNPKVRVETEGKNILKQLGSRDILICLDERGKGLTSRQLAVKLRSWVETPSRTPCFVVGGAYGLSDQVLKQAEVRLSLGPMTLPHDLARLVLCEQLYRAAAINHNLPYHHGGRAGK
jgi:23S rRNA (pseudouridine1915-N3)-methyltransferase